MELNIMLPSTRKTLQNLH